MQPFFHYPVASDSKLNIPQLMSLEQFSVIEDNQSVTDITLHVVLR